MPMVIKPIATTHKVKICCDKTKFCFGAKSNAHLTIDKFKLRSLGMFRMLFAQYLVHQNMKNVGIIKEAAARKTSLENFFGCELLLYYGENCKLIKHPSPPNFFCGKRRTYHIV